ncbi:hypothetical protein TNCV_697921 [Trichonephila clavipes]|nr:hypothetical protein TNCV_697921 [Trichonephila clavipes]
MFAHLSLVTFSPFGSDVTKGIPFTLTMSGFSYPKGIKGFTPSANNERITALLSSLVQIDNRAALSNDLLHPNDCEETRVTRCVEKLPTTSHSALDYSIVAKP